jgi:PAS domain S-box-containing protein
MDPKKPEINKLEKDIIKAIPYPLYVINSHTMSVEFSNEAAKNLGITEGENCKKKSSPIESLCNEEFGECPLKKVLETGKPEVIERKYSPKAGVIRYFEVHIFPLHTGEKNSTFVIETLVDISEKKNSELELKAREHYITQILDNSNDAIFLHSFNFRTPENFMAVNKAASKLLEYTEEQLLEKSVSDIIKDYKKLNPEKLHKIFSTSGRLLFENEFINKSGKTIPVEINSSVIEFFNTKTVLSVVRDISARKEADLALKASEEKYRILVDNSTEGIIVSVNNKIVFSNNSAADILGYSRNELELMSVENFIGTDTCLEKIKKYKKDVLTSKDPKAFEEIEITGANNKKVDALISIYKTEFQKEDTFIYFIRDITLQKKEREEIKQMAYFSQLNPSPVIRFNKSGKILLTNDSATHIFPFLNETVDVYINEIFKDLYGDEIKASIDTGKILYREITVKNSYFHFIIKGVPELNVAQAYGLDITKIKKFEEEREMLITELTKANIELKELSRMKDDFVAIVSHDLRSPFNAILGFAEVLLADPDISDENKYYLELINQSAYVQLNYINDILEVLKFEAGELKLRKESLTIEKLITDAVSYNKILAEKKGIALNHEIKCIDKTEADYPKLIQVLNNLISNATKFTKSGGKITVSCFKNSSGFAEIHIKDTGVGIKEEQLASLFSKYTPSHTAGTSGERGSGLGLSICKNIVELHGGSINVSSTYGQGSDFYFTLPL